MAPPPRDIIVTCDEAHVPPDGVLVLPGRAALLPASGTLLAADLHLGKAATFRHAGLPVPEGSAQADLDRLGRLLAETCARRLVILGDLLHAAVGCTPAVIAGFRALRDRFPAIPFLLVLGNHDVAARRHADALGLDGCVARLDEPPLRFIHDSSARDAAGIALTLAGHVHPCARVGGPSGGRVTQRCFHLDATARSRTLILPAFGSFTGGRAVAPASSDRVWMAGDDAVVDVTPLFVAWRDRGGALTAPKRRSRPGRRAGSRPDRGP